MRTRAARFRRRRARAGRGRRRLRLAFRWRPDAAALRLLCLELALLLVVRRSGACLPQRARAAATPEPALQRCLLASRVLQRFEHCFTSLYPSASAVHRAAMRVQGCVCAALVSYNASSMLGPRPRFEPYASRAICILPHGERATQGSRDAQWEAPCEPDKRKNMQKQTN